MSNDNLDPKLNKDMHAVAGSVFGIDIKKKHDLDFLDDFDSGFDLSQITGIPAKKETPASPPASKSAAEIKAPQPVAHTEDSTTRMGLNDSTTIDSASDEEIEVDFSWEEEEEIVQDDFGAGIAESAPAKAPQKKVRKKVAAETPHHPHSMHPEPAKAESKPQTKAPETPVAATTQPNDGFWDPLEDWSWDDSTHQPVESKPARNKPASQDASETKSAQPEGKSHKQKHRDKKKKFKEDRTSERSQPAPKSSPSKPEARKPDLDDDFDDLEDSSVNVLGNVFDQTPRKTLNLDDLLNDWDSPPSSSVPPRDEFIDDDIVVNEADEDDLEEEEEEFTSRKSKSRSQKPKTRERQARKPEPVTQFHDDDEDEEEDLHDDFDFEDVDEEETSYSAPRKPLSKRPSPKSRPDSRTEPRSEARSESRPERAPREREASSKPSRQAAKYPNIPTWEEAISIVLEANSHLMTVPAKYNQRTNTQRNSPSSSTSETDSPNNKKRGRRGPHRRKKN